MGNCQAAETATVVIQHPDGKSERVYWSISASHVMASNPGHYVAVIIAAPHHPSSKSRTGEASRNTGGSHPSGKSSTGGGHPPVKHLKLLRPDDTLLMGQVYRLVSFEEVVRKFETKRHAKLSRMVEKIGDIEKSSSRNRRKNEDEDEDEKRSHGGGEEEEEPKNSLEQTDSTKSEKADKPEDDDETDELVSMAQALIRRAGSRPNQWRPALHTISEAVGT